MPKQQYDRRKYYRTDVSCPVTVSAAGHSGQAKGNTLNLSDGGALLTIPINSMPGLAERVAVQLSLPRTTPNTRMYEDLASQATVVRHQPMIDERLVGVAIRFSKVMKLNLEV